MKRTAYDELKKHLAENEIIEGIVLGDWTGIQDPKLIPKKQRNIVLTEEQAKPLMKKWRFFESGSNYDVWYDIRVWTNKQVIWVQDYGGEAVFFSVARSPVASAIKKFTEEE